MPAVVFSPIFNAWQGFTSGGIPLSGGKINAYLAGTSTPHNTYTTVVGNVANSNPIVLQSDGRPPFEIWLETGIAYKFVLTDSLGLNPITYDNISGSLGGSDIIKFTDTIAQVQALDVTKFTRAFAYGYYADGDGGGGSYWYDASDTTSTANGGTIVSSSTGSGRWKLVLTGPVSVKQFGAKGDYNGTTGTDDTATIQACINWVQANTNTVTYGSYSPSAGTGVVYFPQGSFRATSPLIVTTKICVLGEGQTEFSYGSRLTQTSANTDLFQISAGAGSTSFSIENMVLRSNAGVGTGHLVNMVRTGGGTVNSQRYLNCTFAQPQAMSLYLAGDDIVVKNCLFDVSQQSGNCIQFGTAGQGSADVRIEGCDFFNPTNSCIKVINCVGLVISGNLLSQPNGSTKTPYFVDAITTAPTNANNITLSNNVLQGPRTVFGGNGTTNVVVSGNSVTGGGQGAGETLNMFTFTGSDIALTMVGNTFRGTYDTKNFYNDAGASNVTGLLANNSFQNDGGAGDALACTKFTGRLESNFYAGFTNRQMGEKRATAGNAVNPGNITTLNLFAFALTVPSATFGDTVEIGTINNAWMAATGIDIIAFINAANTVRVEYRNVTAGTINVPAHDIWCEVTR